MSSLLDKSLKLTKNTFTDEMIVYFNVLSPSMKDMFDVQIVSSLLFKVILC